MGIPQGQTLRDPHEFINNFLTYQWVMIFNTRGSISEIDPKSLNLLEKSRRYQLCIGPIQKPPMSILIPIYVYLKDILWGSLRVRL